MCSHSSHLQTVLDKLALTKTITVKKKKPDWISSEIGLLMSKKDAIHRKYLSSRYWPILDKFLCLSKTVEMQTDAAQCAFMHTKSEEAVRENKTVWK